MKDQMLMQMLQDDGERVAQLIEELNLGNRAHIASSVRNGSRARSQSRPRSTSPSMLRKGPALYSSSSSASSIGVDFEAEIENRWRALKINELDTAGSDAVSASATATVSAQVSREGEGERGLFSKSFGDVRNQTKTKAVAKTEPTAEHYGRLLRLGLISSSSNSKSSRDIESSNYNEINTLGRNSSGFGREKSRRSVRKRSHSADSTCAFSRSGSVDSRSSRSNSMSSRSGIGYSSDGRKTRLLPRIPQVRSKDDSSVGSIHSSAPSISVVSSAGLEPYRKSSIFEKLHQVHLYCHLCFDFYLFHFSVGA